MAMFVYLLLIASTTGAMGVVILFRRISLFTHGTLATGAFAQWKPHGTCKIYYYPVIRFTARDGKEYQFTGGPGSTKREEKSTYRVIYPPGAPEKAMVLSFFAFWAAAPAFLILSAALAFAAFQQHPK